MFLLFGLGNFGSKYQAQRHNAGYWLIESLLKKLNLPPLTLQKKLKTRLSKDKNLILAINETFMNECGPSLQSTAHFYKIKPSNIYLAHDDLDLEVGESKIQFDRGPAGHHGVESVIQALGTQSFHRIRLGIGRHPKITPEKYVLTPPNFFEKLRINKNISQTSTDIISKLKLSGL